MFKPATWRLRKVYKQTDRQTDGQTGIQTNRQTDNYHWYSGLRNDTIVCI